MKHALLRMSIAVCLFLIGVIAYGQATINVRVLSVQVNSNVDCDGFLSGDSDFVWEFVATDNTLGYSNNNPVLFGLLGDFNYAFKNGDNGPYVMTAPGGGFSPNSGLYFAHDYVCASDIPTQINIAWRAYENDELTNYSLLGLLTDGETANQNVVMAVPGAPGVNWQTFTANSTDGGCNQQYQVTFEVERINLPVTPVPDDICNAMQIPMNTTMTFGLCSSNTLEPNEPHTGDVTANGSSWVYFIAPAGGEVEVTTDLSGTEIGTYFEIYHAADGPGCNAGVQPITGTLIKDKFEYLSHIEFSDGIDLLGIDPEAEIILDACDPLAPFSYQKLIPGQAYYVQLATDDSNTGGYMQFRVNDLGGSAGDLEDIPCLSPSVAFGTTPVSSPGGSPATVNLDFGCALDGGNDFGETGSPHTGNNPNQYHAYDYNPNLTNNGTMNESVWLNFVAPNSGRIVFETDYQSSIYDEHSALFGYDKQFAPGLPTDFSCADLEYINAAEGDVNGLFGGSNESALILQPCLEPGYTYYGMVDPANAITPFNAQDIDAWLYDPSVSDPINNPPGNDILCLTLPDPLYEVVVTPAGVTPPFQAVAGSNVRACTEFLAGEPPVDPNPANRADQTVWHYFTVPGTGAIEMNIRAYIGMDTLRFAMYELLNGTDCYGGLNPATFTTDGTQLTPIITPVATGSAGFSGTQVSACCLTPGSVYAVQIDGGSPGDEGQYIIEYIREVASYAGDTYVEMSNGTVVDIYSGDTAYVCFNDTLIPGNLLNGIGQPTLDIPSCLDPGFVLHDNPIIPSPVSGSGFTYIDTIQGLNGVFVNNTNGSGGPFNPLFNTVYYVSSMADEPSSFGTFTCNSSTVDNAVPVVFLEPIAPIYSYDNTLCEITFTSSGGLSGYLGSNINFEIYDGSMNLVNTGSFTAGNNIVWPVTAAEIYTIVLNDGACPYSFTIDATACGNPCIISPINIFTNDTICNGQSVFLGGAFQTTPGLYTDVFTAANGCDSTVYTTLIVNPPSYFEQTVSICQNTSYTVGTSTYFNSGVYMDTLISVNGCDSIITTNLFVTSVLTQTISATICEGNTYTFAGSALTTTGMYIDSLTAAGGCDSVVTLFLVVTPTIQHSYAATICQGQSYTHGTQTLTTTGQYPEMFTTAAGCDSIVTLYLTVTSQLTNSISDSICLGESYVLGTQTLTATGIYDEMFQTAGGCDSLVTLNLTVLDCEALLEISNVCTPNDDGANDTWKVSDLNQIQGCTVQIFNRWGQLMYETTDYQNDWNGTKDGEVLPDGVYYYVIGCEEDRQYKGPINLMRFKK